MMSFSDHRDLESFLNGCNIKIETTEKITEKWKELDLDCSICPGTGMPPIKHGQSAELMMAFIYTAMFNALDHPAGIIPNVVKITKEHLKHEYTHPDHPEDAMVIATRECLKGSEGLGMSIQVTTLPGEEEKCLGIMKKIDDLLKRD